MGRSTVDEEGQETLRGKYRFRAVVRKVLMNLAWLTEPVEELEEETDEQRMAHAVLRAKSRRRREGSLSFSLEEKMLFSLPREFRDENKMEKLLISVKGIKTFSNYSEEVQQGLAETLYFIYLTEHRTVLREGQEPQAMYFILQGDVLITVTKEDPYSKELYQQPLAVLTAGDMFGEVALLYNCGRTATVTTSSAKPGGGDPRYHEGIDQAPVGGMADADDTGPRDALGGDQVRMNGAEGAGPLGGGRAAVGVDRVEGQPGEREGKGECQDEGKGECEDEGKDGGVEGAEHEAAKDASSSGSKKSSGASSRSGRRTMKQAVVELLGLQRDDFEVVLRKTLEAQWHRFRTEISRFSYFDNWNETQVREMCILGRLRAFNKDDTILGDGCGTQEYAYFVLSGSCRLVQTITVEVWEEFGDTVYRLLDDPSLAAVRELPSAKDIKAGDRGPDVSAEQLAAQDEWKLAALRVEAVIGYPAASAQWRSARAELERVLKREEPFKYKTIVHPEQWDIARQCVITTLGEHTTRGARRSRSTEQLYKLYGRSATGAPPSPAARRMSTLPGMSGRKLGLPSFVGRPSVFMGLSRGDSEEEAGGPGSGTGGGWGAHAEAITALVARASQATDGDVGRVGGGAAGGAAERRGDVGRRGRVGGGGGGAGDAAGLAQDAAAAGAGARAQAVAVARRARNAHHARHAPALGHRRLLQLARPGGRDRGLRLGQRAPPGHQDAARVRGPVRAHAAPAPHVADEPLVHPRGVDQRGARRGRLPQRVRGAHGRRHGRRGRHARGVEARVPRRGALHEEGAGARDAAAPPHQLPLRAGLLLHAAAGLRHRREHGAAARDGADARRVHAAAALLAGAEQRGQRVGARAPLPEPLHPGHARRVPRVGGGAALAAPPAARRGPADRSPAPRLGHHALRRAVRAAPAGHRPAARLGLQAPLRHSGEPGLLAAQAVPHLGEGRQAVQAPDALTRPRPRLAVDLHALHHHPAQAAPPLLLASSPSSTSRSPFKAPRGYLLSMLLRLVTPNSTVVGHRKTSVSFYFTFISNMYRYTKIPSC